MPQRIVHPLEQKVDRELASLDKQRLKVQGLKARVIREEESYRKRMAALLHKLGFRVGVVIRNSTTGRRATVTQCDVKVKPVVIAQYHDEHDEPNRNFGYRVILGEVSPRKNLSFVFQQFEVLPSE